MEGIADLRRSPGEAGSASSTIDAVNASTIRNGRVTGSPDHVHYVSPLPQTEFNKMSV
jgi:hypothetical protein